jgi:hypothetical protein
MIDRPLIQWGVAAAERRIQQQPASREGYSGVMM